MSGEIVTTATADTVSTLGAALTAEGGLLAGLLGLVIGILSFLPLYWGLKMARKATKTSNLGQMSACLLGLLVSFVLLVAASLLCIAVARPLALPFVLGEAIGLSVTAICFGLARFFGR